LTARLVDAQVDLGRIEEAQSALREALRQVQDPKATEKLTENLKTR
jgi:hypothetical protein